MKRIKTEIRILLKTDPSEIEELKHWLKVVEDCKLKFSLTKIESRKLKFRWQ